MPLQTQGFDNKQGAGVFSPYTQERDHLGRLIDSVSNAYFYNDASMKKQNRYFNFLFFLCVQKVRPKTGTGTVRKDVRYHYNKGKMVLTFKSNVPDRWLDNPDQLPYSSFAKLPGGKASAQKGRNQASASLNTSGMHRRYNKAAADTLQEFVNSPSDRAEALSAGLRKSSDRALMNTT